MASSSSSSSSSSAGVCRLANEIHELVEQCCPKLHNKVEHWLQCYRDPQLLYESLRREYGLGPSVEVVDSSDEEVAHGATGHDCEESSAAQTSGDRPDITGSPHQRRHKAKLCEANLLQKCRWGERCHFAHSDEELRASKRRRSYQAEGPKKCSTCPEGASFLHVLPSNIAFCHDTIAEHFKDGRSILATLLGLASREVSIRDLPMMEVVFFRDQLYSLSNRRLCLYLLCEHMGLIDQRMPVKVMLLEQLPSSFKKKYTTTCKGVSKSALRVPSSTIKSWHYLYTYGMIRGFQVDRLPRNLGLARTGSVSAEMAAFAGGSWKRQPLVVI